jgi:hypothetical protein
MSERDPHEELLRAHEEAQRWTDENALVGVCDFCCRPTREVDGTTFITEGAFSDETVMIGSGRVTRSGVVYTPEWFACERCAPVVEQGDPEKLADHVNATYDRVRVGPMPPDYRNDLASLYRAFFAHNPRKQHG